MLWSINQLTLMGIDSVFASFVAASIMAYGTLIEQAKEAASAFASFTIMSGLLGGIFFVSTILLLHWNTVKRQRAEQHSKAIQQHLQDQLQAIIDNTPAVIFLKDLEGKYLLVNRQFEIDTQITGDRAIGQTADAFFPKAVARHWHAQEQKLLREGVAIEHEEIMRLADGDLTYLTNLYLLRNPQNEPYAICGMATNITKLKRAERQLTQLILLERLAFAELLISRQTLANVLENLADGFVSIDRDWNFTYVNRKAGELLGKSPETLIGKNGWEEFPEGVDSPLYQAIYRAIETLQPEYVENYYAPLDAWFENRVYPSSAGVAVFFQETTERKRIEAELQQYRENLESTVKQRTIDLVEVNRQLQKELQERFYAQAALARKEEEYRTLTENSLDFIIRHDRDLHFLYVNPAFEHATGILRTDCLGKTIGEVGLPPELVQQISEAVETVFTTREAKLHDLKVQRDQRWQYHQAHMMPEFDRNQCVKSVLIASRNITEQKEREATIKEAERRWRYLLDNVDLVVVGLNRLGEVEYVNPFCLNLVGYTADEVIGQKWFEMFLPLSEQRKVLAAFQELVDQEFHPHYQNPILTKDGQERIIAWNNTQLRNPQGKVIGTMSIGEDITERFQLERMKAEFMSVVSHELRTPLTSIQTALDLLAVGLVPLDSERGRNTLQIAAEGAERLTRIVNDILDLERLASGKMSLDLQPCQTHDLITRATDLMQAVADDAGIRLKTIAQTYAFRGDGDRLLQVMTNLLSNAIKFSEPGATVVLKVERDTEAQCLRFSVCDEGRGIPIDQLEHIFERFHQVNTSDSRQKGGTGLGLAICRSIVQQHGGNIWAESIEGKGSQVYFTIPILPG